MLSIEDFCRVRRANLARSRKSWVRTAGDNLAVRLDRREILEVVGDGG